MTFVIGTGSEVKSIGNAGSTTVAKGQCPETVDADGITFGILEKAAEPARGVEGHYRAAAEVADEQLICMSTKCCRSKGDTPRRVDKRKPAAGIQASDKAMKRAGVRIKHID